MPSSSLAFEYDTIIANPKIHDLKSGSWEKMLIANDPVTLYMRWYDRDDNPLGWIEAAEFVPGEVHCVGGMTLG